MGQFTVTHFMTLLPGEYVARQGVEFTHCYKHINKTLTILMLHMLVNTFSTITYMSCSSDDAVSRCEGERLVDQG